MIIFICVLDKNTVASVNKGIELNLKINQIQTAKNQF